MSKAYASIYKDYDPEGNILYEAAKHILNTALSEQTESSLTNLTGFDKFNHLLIETGIVHKTALPINFVINADAEKFLSIEEKLYNCVFDLMNKKYLHIIINANTNLRKSRIGKWTYTYQKGIFLTPIEAQKAIDLELRVDAIESESRYTEEHVGAFFKKRIKKAADFYENTEAFDKNLYLSPEYIAAKVDTDELLAAIRYFVDKEDMFNYFKIEKLPVLYSMVGMPGSGKSTLAYKLNAEVCSSDLIRQEITGSVVGETKGAIEFYLMNIRVRQALMAGVDVVADATALHTKARHATLKNVNGIPHKNICLFFNCQFEDSASRNFNPDRDKNVPVDRLDEMWEYIEVPTLDEGFDEIYDIIVI